MDLNPISKFDLNHGQSYGSTIVCVCGGETAIDFGYGFDLGFQKVLLMIFKCFSFGFYIFSGLLRFLVSILVSFLIIALSLDLFCHHIMCLNPCIFCLFLKNGYWIELWI